MNYITKLKRVPLYRFKDATKGDIVVFLAPLTVQEETIIDETEVYQSNHDVNIHQKDIYFYGEVNPDCIVDQDIIKRKKLVDDNVAKSWIPSNFDYKTGLGDKKGAPTNDPVKWFKYCHCRIGKPRRVIAYKIPVRMI